jgi:hypothetical protein
MELPVEFNEIATNLFPIFPITLVFYEVRILPSSLLYIAVLQNLTDVSVLKKTKIPWP